MGWCRKTFISTGTFKHIHGMSRRHKSGSVSTEATAHILASTDPDMLTLDGYYLSHSISLPSAQASSFHQFCTTNSAAMPLLYVENQDENLFKTAVKQLSTRPTYNIIQNGKLQRHREWNIHEKQFTTFFFGCGGSLEQVLLDAGIKYPQGGQTGVFRTALTVPATDHFSGPLMTTVRPVAKDDVLPTVTATERCLHAHGAPVHIGDPEYLGVDFGNPVFGNTPALADGTVSLFWGCAYTGMFSLVNASRAYPDTAFFTCGGFQLFLPQDLVSSQFRLQEPRQDQGNSPVLTEILSQPLMYTLCCTDTERFISCLAHALVPSHDSESLLKTSLILSHSSAVTLDARSTRFEPGDSIEVQSQALLASVLHSLGKRVVIATNQPDLYAAALAKMKEHMHIQGTIGIYASIDEESMRSGEASQTNQSLEIHHVLRFTQTSDSCGSHIGPSHHSRFTGQVRILTELTGGNAGVRGHLDHAHSLEMESRGFTTVSDSLTIALLALQLDDTHRRYMTKGFEGPLMKAAARAMAGVVKLKKNTHEATEESKEFNMSDLPLMFGYKL